jgi:hypothetical protein
MKVCIYMNVRKYTYVMYVRMYAFQHVSICVHVYIYMHVCIYACVYISTFFSGAPTAVHIPFMFLFNRLNAINLFSVKTSVWLPKQGPCTESVKHLIVTLSETFLKCLMNVSCF